MSGHQRGHQLVAQLLGGHRAAILVAGLEQHRQDVVAVVVARRAALVDQIEDQAVGLLRAVR